VLAVTRQIPALLSYTGGSHSAKTAQEAEAPWGHKKRLLPRAHAHDAAITPSTAGTSNPCAIAARSRPTGTLQLGRLIPRVGYLQVNLLLPTYCRSTYTWGDRLLQPVVNGLPAEAPTLGPVPSGSGAHAELWGPHQ